MKERPRARKGQAARASGDRHREAAPANFRTRFHTNATRVASERGRALGSLCAVRLPSPVWLLALLAVGCTAAGTTSPPASAPTPSASQGDPPVIHVLGGTYIWQCVPVAETLVDIAVSPDGSRYRVRAITGLWDHQAVAVAANDKNGCGRWTLALAPGLSETARAQILAEVRQGVADFGVTASPIVYDKGSGVSG